METFSPDKFDIKILARGLLKTCPFCGHTATTFTQHNPATKIYRANVACSSCDTRIGFNDRKRWKARRGAIRRWQRRV